MDIRSTAGGLWRGETEAKGGARHLLSVLVLGGAADRQLPCDHCLHFAIRPESRAPSVRDLSVNLTHARPSLLLPKDLVQS